MLTHPIIDKLHQLKCLGMVTALTEQLQSTACEGRSRSRSASACSSTANSPCATTGA